METVTITAEVVNVLPSEFNNPSDKGLRVYFWIVKDEDLSHPLHYKGRQFFVTMYTPIPYLPWHVLGRPTEHMEIPLKALEKIKHQLRSHSYQAVRYAIYNCPEDIKWTKPKYKPITK